MDRWVRSRSLATSCAALWLLSGCISQQTLEMLEREWIASQEGINPCAAVAGEPPAALPPGTVWIGHPVEHLREQLGNELFALATPEGIALCYELEGGNDTAAERCVDTYLINRCGLVVSYSCR